MARFLCSSLLCFATLIISTYAFVFVHPAPSSKILVALEAKKSKKNQTGKGFGKTVIPVDKPKIVEKVTSDLGDKESASLDQAEPQSPLFTSVTDNSKPNPTIDQSAPVQDRTNTILRERYGLRSREEQQAEYQRQQQAVEQQKKLKEWKQLAEKGEDFDIIQALPEPALIFIDSFLKAGLAICTVLFVAAGLAITAEAGSKATNNPLPENVDTFITNIIEPNFTPGLLVLLGFSVSLGAFAALQLGSASSTYREDR